MQHMYVKKLYQAPFISFARFASSHMIWREPPGPNMPPSRRLVALLLAAALLAAPAQAADKVLHAYLSTSESALDPAVGSDLATLSLLENLFDPLLRYDYLARPLALRGNTATGLPKVEDKGLSYTFKIRPGIFFTPDPAFQGKKREVTAADYVYSACTIPRSSRPGCRCSMARSPGTRPSSKISATRRRLPDCRRWTATRCASACPHPTTISCFTWQRPPPAWSRAK